MRMLADRVNRHTPGLLSSEHERSLIEGSAISPDVIAERGVCTITRGPELPKGFSQRQKRRAPGILFTVHRPSGGTSHSFRPDELDPRNPGHKYEQPCKYLGGPGNVLDVHPSMHHLIGDTAVPVMFVEGIKKADAITSVARAARVRILPVAIFGVWNFLSGDPIPDMSDISVEGRKVAIGFDSDVLRNPDVQGAAERLAEHLEERGAEVCMVYLPDKPDGSKMGADDFLACGGTLDELLALTRPFNPEDLVCARLSRNERLRASIAAEWSRWWSYDWSRMVGTGQNPDWRRGHTSRDVMKALIDEAKRRGRVNAGVLEVSVSTRRLVELSTKSRPSVGNALRHLEAEVFIEIVEASTPEKPRVYRFLAGRAVLYHPGGNSVAPVQPLPIGKGPRGEPDVPRLRWSSPASPRRCGVVRGTRRVRQGPPPAHRDGVKRPGPGRGAAVDYMERVRRRVPLAEMADALGVARPRDLLRRKDSEKGRDGRLIMLIDLGILAFDGDAFELSPDWRARLEEARVVGGEVEREELERERHRRQREAFRNRRKVHPDRHWTNTPDADGAIEDLHPADEPVEADPDPPPLTVLAQAIGNYLRVNPKDADQPPGWLALTLWAHELYPGKPTPEEAKAALEELGGENYRRTLLKRARGAA